MKNRRTTDFSHARQLSGLSIKQVAQTYGLSQRTVYRWESGQYSPDPMLIEDLKTIYSSRAEQKAAQDSFTFIDLFAGIGGLRKAFDSVGGKCVFTSEWDLACRKTYQDNFVCDHPVHGDIRDIDLDGMPQYDLLLAGFPCQPFSIAGVSKKNALGKPHGFHCDTQGTLFFDVAQMIERHRPKAFLLENVKNLINHDKGNTFRVILRTLTEDLGYSVDYRIVDARNFVPQHRERIFIVGFKEATDFSLKTMTIPQSVLRLGDVLHSQDGSEVPEPPYTTGPRAEVAAKYTLSDRLWSYLQAYAERHRAKGNGFGFGLCGPGDVARTLSARYYKDGSEILVKQQDRNPRRLTPRECARLMGFGNSFRIPVSDTQAYKQFGNSVVVPVVEAVARHMLPHLLQAQSDVSTRGRAQTGSLQLRLFEQDGGYAETGQ